MIHCLYKLVLKWCSIGVQTSQ
ncbi:hypothetical protein Goarm_019558 [Gossypium armourianum]|uniref:Uncharacterized protein n=1 Tax=Gossypium armourianum TaxID=34283 RepID=A0A7J9ILV4_9ROSI|nr:hypothetical protein [Gossypium armourianum]